MSDALVNGLAGAAGGILAQIITYPLLAATTRIQTEQNLKTSSVQLNPESRKVAKTALSDLIEIFGKQGMWGLYRGLGPSLVGTACSQGVYYYFYQKFREQAEQSARLRHRMRGGLGTPQVGMVESLVVAAIAGTVNVLLTNPIWVVVTRVQTAPSRHLKRVKIEHHPFPSSEASNLMKKENDEEAEGEDSQDKEYSRAVQNLKERQRERNRGEFLKGQSCSVRPSSQTGSDAELNRGQQQAADHGVLHTICDLYQEAGILGFWKGVVPTLIMVSNPSLQFMLYETLMSKLTAKRPPSLGGAKSASALEIFVLGAIAKTGATLATYPLLVVKSRLQAKQKAHSSSAAMYTGTMDAIVKILRYEGLAGFYRGIHTKLFQSVFASSVLFLSKEEIVKLVRRVVLERGSRKSTVLSAAALLRLK